MRPELPWSVTGIPQEAREAARVAARREGMSVGEWLTKRIVIKATTAIPEAALQPNGSDERADALPAFRKEPGAQIVPRQVDEELKAFARRMDAAEHARADERRDLNRAISDLVTAARKQAEAFEQTDISVGHLSQRLERLERQASGEILKDAIKGLHQGLARLTDQMTEQGSHATAEIASLAGNLESLAGRASQFRVDGESMAHSLDSRQAQLEARVRTLEPLIQQNVANTQRIHSSFGAISQLEDSIRRLDARTSDPATDQRLNAVEKTLSDTTTDRRIKAVEQTVSELASRANAPDRARQSLEREVKFLGERIAETEKYQRETTDELRHAISAVAEQSVTSPSPDAGIAPPVPAPKAEVAAPDPAPVVNTAAALPAPVVERVEHEEPLLLDTPVTAPGSGFLPDTLLRTMFPHEALHASEKTEQREEPKEEIDETHTAESYLAAARRSALAAAAEADTERLSRGIGGFAWGVDQSRFRQEQSRTRYGVIGLFVLVIVCLLVAATLFSQRLTSTPRFADASQTARHAVRQLSESTRTSTKRKAPLKSNLAPRVGSSETAHMMPPPGSPATGARSVTPRAASALPSPAAATTKALASSVTVSYQAAPTNQQDISRLMKLASSGSGKAQTIVGLDYLEGDGVAESPQQAVTWLERAAENGQPVAQYRLGTLYESGKGVKVDPAKAIHWYEAAALAGNRKAMHNLAVAYVQGAGVSRDYFEAARWFSKAAALGLADSQFNLAVLYERGLGVPQSLLDAYKWYAIAAAQGDTESKARIEAIAAQLSADDRAAAQRTADQFRPAGFNVAANVPPAAKDLGAR